MNIILFIIFFSISIMELFYLLMVTENTSETPSPKTITKVIEMYACYHIKKKKGETVSLMLYG